MLNVTRRFLAPNLNNSLIVQPLHRFYQAASIGKLKSCKRNDEFMIDHCRQSIFKLESEIRLRALELEQNRRALMYTQCNLYQVEEALTQKVEFQKQEILSHRQLKTLSDNQLKVAYTKICSKIEKLELINNYNSFFDAEKAAFQEKIHELKSSLRDVENENLRRGIMKIQFLPGGKLQAVWREEFLTPSEMKEESSTFRRLAGIVFVSSIAYMTLRNSRAANPDVKNSLKLERMPCSSNQQNNQARRILEDLKKESIAIYAQADAAAATGKSSALIAARVRSEMEMSLRKALRQLEASQLSKQS